LVLLLLLLLLLMLVLVLVVSLKGVLCIVVHVFVGGVSGGPGSF
jgi:hypothetical protein